MRIANNNVVRFNYVVKNAAGEILDRSQKNMPLPYLHGNNNLLDGLEHAMEGKQAGDKLDVKVDSANGYGEYNDELVQSVPRTYFGDQIVEIGKQFQADTATGHDIFTVTAITDEQVVIDANHPLVGEDLFYNIEIVDVRDATEEELELGHAHY
ncbi:MAG: peptidylprolyl isomerase [Candidatus Endonucleobacter sp. (ex Gigantidas childressi)]|nr:peptidylprolyl isomerase [Candidatus Endonucleobacter sp. (ex Gigantidas childressi)]